MKLNWPEHTVLVCPFFIKYFAQNNVIYGFLKQYLVDLKSFAMLHYFGCRLSKYKLLGGFVIICTLSAYPLQPGHYVYIYEKKLFVWSPLEFKGGSKKPSDLKV